MVLLIPGLTYKPGGIHGFTGSGYYLKMHQVLRHLDQHKGEISVVRRDRKRRAFLDVPASELSAGTGNKVINALLRPDPLVEMVMTSEYRIYPMLNKKRLSDLTH